MTFGILAKAEASNANWDSNPARTRSSSLNSNQNQNRAGSWILDLGFGMRAQRSERQKSRDGKINKLLAAELCWLRARELFSLKK